jgi:hypothetical protein
MAIKPKDKPHYVNNREFSYAVVDYVKSVMKAEEDNDPLPIVPDYIAMCFMKISQGLSHRPNFIRYSYREEMVMDAVENCLKAIRNYNIDTITRTGKPNAFSYFTQICFFAFIRRITKEKKQQDIKFKFIEKMGIEDFIDVGMDPSSARSASAYVETLRNRIDTIKSKDEAIKAFAKEEKKKLKKLELFMV